ncbi:MAG: putative GTPase or GTP-binding protein [Armatimonadetes bacterium]|jgi:polynucleotide 5'-hydroxyl-kinase GRC3/NOL9|nr:putative GTPase or GTP-binding protein [Armatimonadota bacterium]
MLPNPIEWDEAVQLLAAQSGAVLLVGATDTGKSTLAVAAANEAVRNGRRAAILDADLGQGEVSPPGTLGIIRLEEPVASLAELRPRAMAFVGDTSPYGHLLSIVQGTRRLLTHALDRGDEVVYVDSSGLVRGRLAEKLKVAKLNVLDPSLVLVLERKGELERLASLLAGQTAAPVVRVQSARDVKIKSAVYRRVQRANHFRRHFENARVHELDAGRVRVFDAWVYTGTPLPARQLRALSDALKTNVPHGEITDDGVFLCADGKPDRDGANALQDEFGKKRVTITPLSAFRNLLVGLIAEDGYTLDLGILQAINFERAFFSVITPARSIVDVGQIHFGRLRARPDGGELGRLRPSDL